MAYDFTKEQVLKAIENTMGIMSNVARNLGGVEWHTAERWVNAWECTKKAFGDQRNRLLDLCEVRGFEMVNEKDGGMIRFFLSTIGKDRGYTTETHVSGPDGGAIPVELIVKKLKNVSSDDV